MSAGTGETAVLGACVAPLSPQLAKTTSGLLAHAPRQRSQACSEQMPQWGKHGLSITYWPPEAPTCKLSESLGRFMPYSWLPFSAYPSVHGLGAAVEAILTRFGTEDTINFQAA
jgi:hypothetical protein